MKLRWMCLIVLLAVDVGRADAQFQQIPQWCGASNANCPTAPSGGYINGQLVKFNGTVFVCNASPCTADVSPADSGGGFWNSMSGANQYNSATSYPPGRQVMRNGTMFTALSGNTNVDPSTGGNPQTWVARGVQPVPTFVPSVATRSQIQDAITATPAGGIVQLDCGAFTLDGTAITITKALTVQGCGKRASTALVSPASGEDVITVNTVDGVTFRSFTMQSTGKTGGSFIHWITTTGSFSLVDNMTFAGHLVALDMEAATNWDVTNSYFVGRNDSGTKDIYVHSTVADNGGRLIANNTFDNAGTNGTCIHITSGGGTRIIGNGMLSHAANIVIDWTASGSSSELAISGNSFDGQQPGSHNYGLIVSGNTSGGNLFLVTVTGNSFAGHALGEIVIGGSAPNKINNVVVSGNAFSVNNGATGISSSGTGLMATGNQMNGQGVSASGIVVNADAVSNYVAANSFLGTWGTKTSNASGSSAMGVTTGNCVNGIIMAGTGC